jgi:hypothetical protein
VAEAQDAEEARRDLVSRQSSELAPGEYITSGIGSPVQTDPPSDAEINEKYERGEIRIVTEQGRYPLDSISKLLDAEDTNITLDPDYQRRHRWNVAQKSRLIESFIMNVPVPPIFLYEWDYANYEVMDGLQRMTAIREFYENAFALSDLQYWQELEGKFYRDLPSRIKQGIDRRNLSSIILLKETSHGEEDPQRLKRFVFGRINTGGVQLEPQELRNALYDGPMNDLCKELAADERLRKMWGIPTNVESLIENPDLSAAGNDMLDFAVDTTASEDPVPEAYRKMVDVELVLRFFANRQRMMHYRDNLRDYLDEYLNAANKYPRETIATLAELYRSTLQLAYDLFGEYAFRRMRNGKWGNVPSVSIYDALMNVLSRLTADAEILVGQGEAIVTGLEDFYAANAVRFNLRGQTRADLMQREILFEEYFRNFL